MDHLDAADSKNFLLALPDVRSKCLDVLFERNPLILLYDGSDLANPFKKTLANQYKSSVAYCYYLQSRPWNPCRYFRLAHFKNRTTGDITVRYFKHIKRRTVRGKLDSEHKHSEPSLLMFQTLGLCLNLRYFKFDVSEMRYFIILLASLPASVKAVEISITDPKFYHGKRNDKIHTTELNFSATQLKYLSVKANAGFHDKLTTSSRLVRRIVNANSGRPTETQVQTVLARADKKPKNFPKLMAFNRLLARWLSLNSETIQTIEVRELDARMIFKYRRVFRNLKLLRMIKVDSRSLLKISTWRDQFLTICTAQLRLIPNTPSTYPILVVFQANTTDPAEQKCSVLQKHPLAEDGVGEAVLSGTAVDFFRNYKHY